MNLEVNQKVDIMLELFLYDTMQLFENVINEKEPETSAITTKKRIDLYIALSKDLNESFSLLSFQDVLAKQGYGQEFIKEFEEKISEESTIYRGSVNWEDWANKNS